MPTNNNKNQDKPKSYLLSIEPEELNKLITKDGENLVKFLNGSPSKYMLSMRTGQVNYLSTNITQKGQTVIIIPIAFRIFRAALFGRETTDWLELFFIDDAGCVACMMFHSYSVQNFKALYYSNLKITESFLFITPVLKKHGQFPFYVCDFSQKKAPDDYLKKANEVTAHLDIYRHDSIVLNQEIILFENYPFDKMVDVLELLEQEKKALEEASKPKGRAF